MRKTSHSLFPFVSSLYWCCMCCIQVLVGGCRHCRHLTSTLPTKTMTWFLSFRWSDRVGKMSTFIVSVMECYRVSFDTSVAWILCLTPKSLNPCRLCLWYWTVWIRIISFRSKLSPINWNSLSTTDLLPLYILQWIASTEVPHSWIAYTDHLTCVPLIFASWRSNISYTWPSLKTRIEFDRQNQTSDRCTGMRKNVYSTLSRVQ